MKKQLKFSDFLFLHTLVAFVILLTLPARTGAQQQLTKIRISNSSLTYTALPLLVARDWGFFAANGLEAEIILMSSSLAYPALAAGSVDYLAAIGALGITANLSGIPLRGVWFSGDKTVYWLMARSPYKTLESLKAKKIGISGVGGSNQMALLVTLEKLGANSKDYIQVTLPGLELLRSLETGFIESASLAPPAMFSAQKKGFNRVLDMTVEMPTGGLTTLVKTIQTRPAEVKRVIRSMQMAKEEIKKSKDRTVDYMTRTLKMDKEAASQTYDLYLTTLNPNGIPTRAGMESLVQALQMFGRFADRKISFAEVADDRLATEVAREMGYKIP